MKSNRYAGYFAEFAKEKWPGRNTQYLPGLNVNIFQMLVLLDYRMAHYIRSPKIQLLNRRVLLLDDRADVSGLRGAGRIRTSIQQIVSFGSRLGQ